MKLESNGMPTKRNGAGNQQNYVPAGNEDGGEYTFDSATIKPENGQKVVVSSSTGGKVNMGENHIEVKSGDGQKHSGGFSRMVAESDYSPKFKEHLESQFKTGSTEAQYTIDFMVGDGRLRYEQVKGGRDCFSGGSSVQLSPTVGTRLQGEVFWHESFHGIDHRSVDDFPESERYYSGKMSELTLTQWCSTGIITENGKTMLQTLSDEMNAYRAQVRKNEGRSPILTAYYAERDLRIAEVYPDHEELYKQGMAKEQEFRKQALAMVGEEYEYRLQGEKIKLFEEEMARLREADPVAKRYREMTEFKRKLNLEMFNEWSGISDMHQAMGFNAFNGGHSTSYFAKDKGNKALEFFAEYGSAYATGDTKTLQKFERYFPETSKSAKWLIERIYKMKRN